MPRDIKSILVADDNPAIVGVVQLTLEQAGFNVTVANDGRAAWEHLSKSQFDLVITDQEMPELTGRELCARIRQEQRYAETPIVMLTAKSLELDVSELKKDLGIAAVLPKPFSPSKLVDIVKELTCPEHV